MRVLHVIPSISPTQGGPTFAARTMVRALVAQGVRVDVATTNDDGPANPRLDIDLGVPVPMDGASYYYFQRQTQFYKASQPLSRWLSRHVADYDLVHVHALFSHASVCAARQAHRHGVPYVLHPHGVLNRWGMLNRRRWIKGWSFRLIERPILRRAATVCYTSGQERQQAIEVEPALATLPAAILPLGLDADAFVEPVKPSVFYEKFPQTADHPLVLFLSRLDAKKGLDLLIPAFAKALRHAPGSLLVIAGDGEKSFVAGLRRSAEKLGVDQHIVWTGFLAGDDKAAAFKAATVFALPSYSENFGIAVAEALAAGRPCVLSDQVALAEDAAAFDAALVTPCEVEAVAAALSRLLIEPETRTRLGANARRLAGARFSPEVAGARLRDLYQSLISPDGSEALVYDRSHPAHPHLQ